MGSERVEVEAVEAQGQYGESDENSKIGRQVAGGKTFDGKHDAMGNEVGQVVILTLLLRAQLCKFRSSKSWKGANHEEQQRKSDT